MSARYSRYPHWEQNAGPAMRHAALVPNTADVNKPEPSTAVANKSAANSGRQQEQRNCLAPGPSAVKSATANVRSLTRNSTRGKPEHRSIQSRRKARDTSGYYLMIPGRWLIRTDSTRHPPTPAKSLAGYCACRACFRKSAPRESSKMLFQTVHWARYIGSRSSRWYPQAIARSAVAARAVSAGC
jgi:hypothetical protein